MSIAIATKKKKENIGKSLNHFLKSIIVPWINKTLSWEATLCKPGEGKLMFLNKSLGIKAACSREQTNERVAL